MEISLYLDPKNPRKKRPIKVFKTTVALAKGYSKKMDVYYLCSSVFVFTFKRKNNKTEYSNDIYATVVITNTKYRNNSLKLKGKLSFHTLNTVPNNKTSFNMHKTHVLIKRLKLSKYSIRASFSFAVIVKNINIITR